MEDIPKIINIKGTSNRYLIKKLIKNNDEKEIKKRIESKKWNFSEENYNYINQLNILDTILINNLNNNEKDDISKIIIQQINKKIGSYKQQDIIKNIFNNDEFINLENIIHKMIQNKLKCYYCSCEMLLLYNNLREMTQWTIDRIDNDKGHNKENFHLACLDCNLKRRRRTDENFLFTKQLSIVKKE